MLKKHQYAQVRRAGYQRGPPTPPFYAASAKSVVAVAAVFPDPDKPPFKPWREGSRRGAEHRVLYRPSFVEVVDPHSVNPSLLPGEGAAPEAPYEAESDASVELVGSDAGSSSDSD